MTDTTNFARDLEVAQAVRNAARNLNAAIKEARIRNLEVAVETTFGSYPQTRGLSAVVSVTVRKELV